MVGFMKICDMDKLTLNIKNIKGLNLNNFPIHENGLYVITGPHGVGKSTLLSCIDRIGNAFAFRDHLPKREDVNKLAGAEVCFNLYNIENKLIKTQSFKYDQNRWRTGERQSNFILSGFRNTIFLGSNRGKVKAKSFTQSTYKEAKENNKIGIVSDENKLLLSNILGDEKWKNLQIYIKEDILLLPVDNVIISEAHFSFAERVICKTILEIESQVNSVNTKKPIILLDEIELGLSYDVLSRLVGYLLAKSKDYLILVASHSMQLLEDPKIKKIIINPRRGGAENSFSETISIIKSTRLFNVENNKFNATCVVEDDKASVFLTEIIKALSSKYSKEFYRDVLIIYIGGYPQCIAFIHQFKTALSSPKVCAVLDPDSADTLKTDHKLQSMFNENKHLIMFLPKHPEIAIVEFLWDIFNGTGGSLKDGFLNDLESYNLYIKTNTQKLEEELKKNEVDINLIITDGDTADNRRKAKRIVDNIVNTVPEKTRDYFYSSVFRFIVAKANFLEDNKVFIEKLMQNIT